MNRDMTPQQIAEATAKGMYERDHTAHALGMVVEAVAPGRARLTMTVRKDMVNGHDICHGGLIFTLADSAFAYACNSYNHVTVAQGATIEFLAPGKLGDVLTATGTERHVAGKTGVYDIEVANQDGKTIALFRGKSFRIRGHVVPGIPTIDA